MRGDAYRKLEQYDKALADYDAAQRIDQDVADTWTLYAQSLKQAGRDQDAAERCAVRPISRRSMRRPVSPPRRANRAAERCLRRPFACPRFPSADRVSTSDMF